MIQNEENNEINEEKENNTNKNKDNASPIESDQLKMWECTSIKDIKRARKLKFILNKSTKELKIDNNHSVNETAVRCSDNPIYLGNMLEKLPSELSRLKYDIFGLEKGDEIFKLITHEKLKKK
mgnify:FL=1